MKILFHLEPYREPKMAHYQHAMLTIAEGLKELGVEFYGNIDYWYDLEDQEYTVQKAPEGFTPDVSIYSCWYVIRNKDTFLDKVNYDHINVLLDAQDGWETPVLWPIFDDFDLILSPAMGGVVIGYEIGKLLKKETIFSERVNGEFKLRRDFKIKKNSKVLIIEDVITTGKSSLECSKLVTLNNGIIIGYACIIDRSDGKSVIKDKIVSQVKLNIPTFPKNKLPKELSSIEPVKPGSRNL